MDAKLILQMAVMMIEAIRDQDPGRVRNQIAALNIYSKVVPAEFSKAVELINGIIETLPEPEPEE